MRRAIGIAGIGVVALGAVIASPTVASAEDSPAEEAPAAVADGVVAYGSSGVVTIERDGVAEAVATYDFEPDFTAEQLGALALSNDGSVLAFQTFDAYANPWTSTTTVIDVATGETIAERAGQYDEQGYLVDVSPDGDDLLMLTQVDTALEDVATGDRAALPGLGFQQPAGQPIGFTPDGASIVTTVYVGDSGSTHLYDVAAGTSSELVPAAPNTYATAQTVSPDGTVLVERYDGCGTAMLTSAVGVDGAAAGELAEPATDHRAVFSPDGAQVLFVREDAPREALCMGDSIEQPVDVLLADRDGSGAEVAFTAVAWDWAVTPAS